MRSTRNEVRKPIPHRNWGTAPTPQTAIDTKIGNQGNCRICRGAVSAPKRAGRPCPYREAKPDEASAKAGKIGGLSPVISIVAGLAIYYVLPLSVWGASKLSRVITAPSLEQAEKGFEQTKDKLFPADPEDGGGWVKKLRSIPERIEQIGTYLKEKAKDLTVWTIKIIAGYVFDCIVFPITLFILLVWLTRAVMRYVFQKNLQRSFREDLNAVFGAEKK